MFYVLYETVEVKMELKIKKSKFSVLLKTKLADKGNSELMTAVAPRSLKNQLACNAVGYASSLWSTATSTS